MDDQWWHPRINKQQVAETRRASARCCARTVWVPKQKMTTHHILCRLYEISCVFIYIGITVWTKRMPKKENYS